MSKASEAKKIQGYVDKAIPRTCMTCNHFTHDTITQTHGYGSFTRDTNLRCSIGGFAVKKMATCNGWEVKR
jgi:hypothetical protein